MDTSKIEVKVVSDVSSRNGIGVEVFYDKNLVLDIFRDDIKKTKEITILKKMFLCNWWNFLLKDLKN